MTDKRKKLAEIEGRVAKFGMYHTATTAGMPWLISQLKDAWAREAIMKKDIEYFLDDETFEKKYGWPVKLMFEKALKQVAELEGEG